MGNRFAFASEALSVRRVLEQGTVDRVIHHAGKKIVWSTLLAAAAIMAGSCLRAAAQSATSPVFAPQSPAPVFPESATKANGSLGLPLFARLRDNTAPGAITAGRDGASPAPPTTESPILIMALSKPKKESVEPDYAANPGRPSLALPATLTPLGYPQYESGMLVASGSSEFSMRTAEEETMKLTVSPRVELLLSAEPVAHSSGVPSHRTAEGDVSAGIQVLVAPGEGIRPTISAGYTRLLRAGSATGLDLGGFVNGAVLLLSADLAGFHVDENLFLNEQTEDRVRRAQFGQAAAVSHPVTKKLGMIGEFRSFTQPLSGGKCMGVLWAATYAVRPNLVLDAALSPGTTATSTHWQVASGVTYVLPRRLWGAPPVQ